ncbi:MAG: transposase [Candidatus Binatia bacterium]
MSTPTYSPTVNELFFQPLEEAIATASSLWPCPEFPDDVWIRMGVQRVLEASESGRGFLQEHGLRFENPPGYNNYFASLRSERRRDLARDVNLSLITLVEAKVCDRLAGIPELTRYACFAGDGHWHKAAVHDPRHDGSKMAVGHFYALNLRTHTLRHLAVGEGLHEHDMSALKRIKPKGLRQDVAKGTRVLIIYDKAGIDFDYWDRCRRECAAYFISRVKENMIFEWIEDYAWDKSDARNHGVIVDSKVRSREGHVLRLIMYQDPLSGKVYEFLTNEPDLPPGVIAELYRRRWEAEKVFDEVKNKLGQKKAWGTSLVAKESQALLIAMTHNLLLCYEQDLEQRHEVKNTAENQRRTQRIDSSEQSCAKVGWPISSLVLQARRATQRSIKFIRWLRHAIRERLAEPVAVARLNELYAVL